MIRLLPGLVVLLLVGCSSASHDAPAPSPAPDQPPARLQALGRLEPAGGVWAVGGTTGDRLERLEVQVGDDVQKGQVLAVLDSHKVRAAQFEAAKVQLADAERRLAAELDYARRATEDARLAREQALLGRTDLAASEAQVRALTASRAQAARDLERLEGADPSVVSPQQLEHQQLLVEKTTEELAAAEAQLTKLRETVELAIKAADSRLATAEAARERVEATAAIPSLKAALDLAEAQMNSSLIKAPAAGRVLRILSYPGETLAQKPILELANVAQMVAIAEVDETQIRWVAKGQSAEVASRAFPADVQHLTGKVIGIGQTVAKNSLLALDPTQTRSDARVVEVRIALDNSAVASRLINLQVDITIHTGQ